MRDESEDFSFFRDYICAQQEIDAALTTKCTSGSVLISVYGGKEDGDFTDNATFHSSETWKACCDVNDGAAVALD